MLRRYSSPWMDFKECSAHKGYLFSRGGGGGGGGLYFSKALFEGLIFVGASIQRGIIYGGKFVFPNCSG